MAYNGISPYLYKNSVSTVDIFDDISGSFNGVTTTFNITVGGASYTRFTAKACLIILGGIVQEAGVDYTVNAGQITFTTAPVSGLTFEGRHLFGLNGVDTPTSGSVVPVSLSTGGPSWDTSGNLTLTGQLRGASNFIIDPAVVGDDTGTVEIKGNLTVQGTTTTINSTTLTIDDKNIVVADGVSTLANLDTSGIDFGSTAVRLRYNYNGGSNSGLSIEGTNVGIGTTAPLAVGSGTSLQLGGGNFAILNLSTSNSGVDEKNWRIISRWTGAAAGPVLEIQTLSDNGTSEATAVRITRSSNSVDNLQLWTTGTARLYINSSGNIGIGTTNPSDRLDIAGNVLPNADATYNLGSTTKRWNNVYTTDLQLSNEGSQNDVDGTWGTYTIQEGENDLFLLNRRNGKKYKFILQEVN